MPYISKLAVSKLADLEGGPYPPLTQDELDRHTEVLRQRVFAATRAFLINVSASEEQRKAANLTAQSLLSELVDDATGLQQLELEG